MDTFLCSSWYFLRYLSPHDAGAAFSEDAARQWLPVDLYTGGAEHAVMHLLYARFFTKAMRDIGLVEFGEPFKRLFNQGTIIADRQKMSKSRGNVVNPDEYVSALGVDAVRAFLMFLGPWEQGGDWNDNGLSGVSRWLNRVWNLVLEPYQPDVVTAVATADLVRLTHQTVKKVTGDFERIHFNTMIAALMEYTNALYKFRDATSVEAAAWQQAVTTLMLLLAPTAPHITEELWELSGHPYSVHQRDWPVWDAALAQDEEVTLVVQVNGKLRDRITVAADSADDLVRELALASPKVRAHTEGRDILKVVVVGGKLVNLVVR